MASEESFTDIDPAIVTPVVFEVGPTDQVTFAYFTDTDPTGGACDQSDVIHFGASFTPLFFSVVTILSLFGNILVLVILVKYENLKAITNTFVLNLAVSDLFFTAGLPFWAHYHYMSEWTLGGPLCTMMNFIFYVGFYSSGFFLILMTFHRYVAVTSPLSDIVSITGPANIAATVIVWTVSVLASSPVFVFIKASDDRYCGFDSNYGKMWTVYQQNVLFILISGVFIFCYTQILWKLLHPPAQRRKSKTVKIIFILMIVFFVGWGPYNVVIFMHTLEHNQLSKLFQDTCEATKNLHYAFYIARFLAFSHCCLNPVFYVFVGVKFKTHLKKLLKSWGHSNNTTIRNRQSRLTITSHTSGEEFSL